MNTNQIDNQLEDEDAAVYRRAKQAVDELHRARKFEKSIKLRWMSRISYSAKIN